MGCRVLQKNDKKITFAYKGASHKGIDLVGPGSTLDYIVAHSDGIVDSVVSHIDYNTSKTGAKTYGNYVKIRHDNGMYTLYAHMKYGSVKVKAGEKVSRGQVIGYMGNTGYSFGAHLHFEVRDKNNNYIDPTGYVDADLPNEKVEEKTSELKHKVGEEVTINGIYTSSSTDKKLNPAYTKGTITKILVGTKNPYLLDNGKLGWTNDNCIVSTAVKNTNSSIKVGDTVKVKQGARSYKGAILASFVFKNSYTVMELKGDRAVIGKNGAVTTDINIANLYK